MRDGKYVVLCVDDDEYVRDQLQVVLEASGYLTALAPNAATALGAYEEQQPDLLIVDLMMESVDAGLELARKLRERGNKAPVYMLSSAGDALYQQADVRQHGLAGVLQKPVDAKAVLDAVRGALGE
ncbi:MAG: response regulator [Armatimonadetes bacterium]|nr:response regulator [Armatimonadota bacterium]